MKKQNLLLFLVIFSIGIIVTYPAFANAHSLDSYCTLYNGYNDTAILFLQNGRIFSALAFAFFGLVNLPYDSLSFVSAFLTNLFLALAIVKLYLMLQNNLKLENKMKKIILLISVFLIFYNPLFTEVLVLDESFVLALGILLVVLVVNEIFKGKIINYLIAIILMILAVSCYQGIACYLFPLLILMLCTIKENNILIYLKKLCIALLTYALAFLSSFTIIKIVEFSLNTSLPKTIEFDLFDNITLIFTDLLPSSISNLFGFVNVNVYYAITLLLFGFVIYQIVSNKNKKINLLLTFLLILSCLLCPFVPNLVMSGSGNYTAARMALTLGILPSILCILMVSRFEIKIKFTYFLAIMMLATFCLNAYSIHKNTMINFKRYKEDVKYINNITEKIAWYENKNDIKIKNIYYAKDLSSQYYYTFGNANGANIRLFAIDWATQCAFPVYTNKKYEFKQMSEEDYKKYFKNKNYDEFNEEQLIFVKDTLYLLLY